MYPIRVLACCLVATASIFGSHAYGEAPDIATRNAMCLKPSGENPYYWQYRGKPIVLLGGSVEDNLFQIPELEAHLDRLAASGGNYVRNTLSSRDEGNLWMFHRLENGKYDLDHLNDAYYARLQHFLDHCLARDIMVQFELWDRFDYAREQWHDNPFRPANNITYTVETSGLKNDYPEHPGSNQNPFFRSVPAHDNHPLLLKYQQQHLERVLAIALAYPNVLYCMDNETGATPDWGAYWSQYVKDKAKALGVIVQTTEMWDDWNLQGPQHRATLDHPEIYSFIDSSQNNHQKGQAHWDNLQWLRGYIKEAPRPINHVKAYGADGGQFGDSRDGVERFWRSLVGGAASIRFHRPASGLGLSPRAEANIKSARMLCEAYDFVGGAPLRRDAVIGTLFDEMDENEAHVHRNDGSYVVYMPRGGEIRLRTEHFGAAPTVAWLDIENSTWQSAVSLSGNDPTLSPPGEGPWVALLRQH